jgi:hypothetical protein
MYHDGNVEEEDRKRIFVARLMLKILETPMTGKVDPDAEDKMFCLNAVAVVDEEGEEGLISDDREG